MLLLVTSHAMNKIFKLKRLSHLLYHVRRNVTVLQANHTATYQAFACDVTRNELETGQDIRILGSDWAKTGKDILKAEVFC